MDVRELLRGTVEWDRIERVAATLAERYDREEVHVRFLEADNWLSTPCVIDDEWFVKIITRQNTRVHGVLTTGRNLGALSSGTEGFFVHFDTPLAMAEHEFEATRRMREIGVNAPRPIEVFEANGLGVLVLEYLPTFRTLDECADAELSALAAGLFSMLARLHADNLAHGDLRGENILVVDDELYFIAATRVSEEGLVEARAYDVACALAVLQPRIGARETVGAALRSYDPEELLPAREFLDFVNFRPDHHFDASLLKGEIEKVADVGTSA